MNNPGWKEPVRATCGSGCRRWRTPRRRRQRPVPWSVVRFVASIRAQGGGQEGSVGTRRRRSGDQWRATRLGAGQRSGAGPALLRGDPRLRAAGRQRLGRGAALGGGGACGRRDLAGAGGLVPRDAPGSLQGLVLPTADVHATHLELVARGVAFDEPPRAQPGGVLAVFRDPDRNGPFGEQTDDRARAEMLDEGLAILAGLWSGRPLAHAGKHDQLKEVTFLPRPLQQPWIPIWVGGYWSRRRPMRRAAGWDGVVPGKRGCKLRRRDLREIVAYVAERRTPVAVRRGGRRGDAGRRPGRGRRGRCGVGGRRRHLVGGGDRRARAARPPAGVAPFPAPPRQPPCRRAACASSLSVRGRAHRELRGPAR